MMLKYFLKFFLLWIIIASSSAYANNIGFKQIILNDDAERPLNVTLWYPTKDITKEKLFGETPIFYGHLVIENAKIAKEHHPLVVMSHGLNGTWRNLSWLASELARQGFIVAAPDHPGTSAFDKNLEQAQQIWQRPHDLSRVIDYLIATPDFANKIDHDKIVAIGFSLGAWTVLAMEGAQFDQNLFKNDCNALKNPRDCALLQPLGLDNITPDYKMADPRIKAAILLDIGLARGFTQKSLNGIKIPTLILAAGVDIGDLPAKLQSGYIAENLPSNTTNYIEIADAIHFSFMQICKTYASSLSKEISQSQIMCKDGGDRTRAEIHKDIINYVSIFLNKEF